MNHAKKPDSNQKAIVEETRARGLKVWLTYRLGEGFPDILVGGELPCPHCGKTFWQERVIEIKSDTGKLTPSEIDFWGYWKNGEATIARNWEELAAELGLAGHSDVRNTVAASQDDRQTNQDGRRTEARNPDARTARRVSQKSKLSGVADSGNPGTH